MVRTCSMLYLLCRNATSSDRWCSRQRLGYHFEEFVVSGALDDNLGHPAKEVHRLRIRLKGGTHPSKGGEIRIFLFDDGLISSSDNGSPYARYWPATFASNGVELLDDLQEVVEAPVDNLLIGSVTIHRSLLGNTATAPITRRSRTQNIRSAKSLWRAAKSAPIAGASSATGCR